MTDYCTVANVEARIKGITFSGSTAITSTEVGDFITTNSAVIDGRLNAVYEVPITGTVSLAIVKKICIYLTLPEVLEVLDDGLGRAKNDETSSIDYRDLANQMLNKLETGELALTDATPKTSNDFFNSNVNDSVEPVMEKDTVQW